MNYTDDYSGLTLLLFATLYFLPTMIAGGRGHQNAMAIFGLNLFLGWTLLGWIIAVVWSLTAVQVRAVTGAEALGEYYDPVPATHRKCPFCAEEIKIEAKVCKHCQRDLQPALDQHG